VPGGKPLSTEGRGYWGTLGSVDGLELRKGTEEVGTDKMRGTSGETFVPDFTICIY